jgi:hypothetical protein
MGAESGYDLGKSACLTLNKASNASQQNDGQGCWDECIA